MLKIEHVINGLCPMTPKNAELIAVKGLQYLASDEEQLGRFLSLSGCEPSQIRVGAGEPEFLHGILEFFMGNEATLLAFCAHHSIDPVEIAAASHTLSGAGDEPDPNYEIHSI